MFYNMDLFHIVNCRIKPEKFVSEISILSISTVRILWVLSIIRIS